MYSWAIRLDWNKVAASLVLLLWCAVSLISINHLYPLFNSLKFTATFIGLLGWLTISSSLIYLSRGFWHQTFLVFLLFLCFGYWSGPFLEPPSDPLEHLKRIHSICNEDSGEILQVNSGFWHYSMAGTVICSDSENTNPDTKLRRIDATHGLFLGLLMSGLFILARYAGLTLRWAFFSCLVAFLFMGTNRFSYFTYYSLAPSYTSMLICWLWTAFFFFRSDRKALVVGTLVAMLSLPFLWVNHRQEAVFIGLLVSVWILLNVYSLAFRTMSEKTFFQTSDRKCFGINTHCMINILLLSLFFLLFFILPQFDFIQNILSRFFVRDLWLQNQHLVVTWNELHLFGRIWSNRIDDTLGNIGIVMFVLTIPYFWPRFIRQNLEKKVRLWILAFLPFLGYTIQLFHFVWLSNVRSFEYYRLCYVSFFWLFFADLLQGLEGRFYLGGKKIFNKFAGQ